MNRLLVWFFLMITFSGYLLAQEKIEIDDMGVEDDEEVFGFFNKDQRYQVSIYNVVANQEKFDGKPVFLFGYAGFYTNHLFLFPDKTSCLDAFLVNGISISLTSDEYKKVASKYKNCEQIIAFGKYKKTNRYGHENSSDLLLGMITEAKIYD